MKKLFALLLICFPLPATTLTGTLKYPNGVGVDGTLYLSLSQVAALSSNGSCGGPIEVAPTYQVPIKVIAGVMQSPPAIFGNDCLIPQGTFYNAKLFDNGANVVFADRWYLAGASVDVGTIVSMVITGTQISLGSPGVTLTAPVVSQTIAQPPGTQFNVNFLNVTGTLTAPNGATCTTSGCTGFQAPGTILTSGNYTITGSWTFTQPILSGPSNDIGSGAAPFRNGWFTDQVITSNLKLVFGADISVPDDFMVMRVPQFGQFELVDSANVPILSFSGASVNWFFVGNVAPSTGLTYDLGKRTTPWRNLLLSGSVQMFGTNGADLDCSTITSGFSGLSLREDTQSLQACIGGNLYQVQLQ